MIVNYVATIPVQFFSLQVQLSASGNSYGPIATLAMTTTTTTATILPAVIASYDPSPAPFKNGAACAFSLQLGCLWEFKILFHEFNGIPIRAAVMTETYTFPSGATVNTLPVIIAGASLSTVVRSVQCGSATISCIPVSDQAGGTYTFRVDGQDLNGVTFTFVGPTLTLQSK